MSPQQSTLNAKRTSVEGRAIAPRGDAGFAGKCLLVGSDEAFLVGMTRAAASAGWDCASCPSPEASLRQAFLRCFGLAIVDIEPNKHKHRRYLADLFRLLHSTGGGLVIACDRSAAPDAELWAREHGVWLYVPGEAEWDQLSLACAEARRLHERSTNRGALGASN